MKKVELLIAFAFCAAVIAALIVMFVGTVGSILNIPLTEKVMFILFASVFAVVYASAWVHAKKHGQSRS